MGILLFQSEKGSKGQYGWPAFNIWSEIINGFTKNNKNNWTIVVSLLITDNENVER